LTLNDEALEGNSKRVFQFIIESPGCHLRKIKRELAISMGTAQYHLGKLEKMRKIVSQKHGLRKHYFVLGVFGQEERALLQVLGNETAREILMLIGEQADLTQTDIVNRIGISHPSVNWHIRRLSALGIIEQVREGKFKRFKFHGDPKHIVALLRNYYPSVWDRWSSKLAETFLALSREASQPADQQEEEPE
jgi:predicted transcriptional regulator